jgi:hypothetical protein
MTRADWTHPDLRHYSKREARRRAVDGWTNGLRHNDAWQSASRLRRVALWAFVAIISRRYAQGFADGLKAFQRAEAKPPTEQWMLWPRLGYAADGLPRA